MKIGEIEEAAVVARAKAGVQEDYVKSMQAKLEAGHDTIDVFCDNTWTTVDLRDFCEIQENLLKALEAKANLLETTSAQLQSDLDVVLGNTKPPAVPEVGDSPEDSNGKEEDKPALQ